MSQDMVFDVSVLAQLQHWYVFSSSLGSVSTFRASSCRMSSRLS